MISLKRTKKEMKKENGKIDVAPSYQEEYPYGTRINFQTEELKKLPGLSDLDVGDYVSIKAVGCIVEKSEHSMAQGEDSKRIEIQIEKISIDSKSEENKGFNSKDED